MKAWPFICAAALVTGTAQGATIYLCKAYNGSNFWASAHCSQHNALIDRIENVADGVPWAQQVQHAENGRAARTQQAQADTGDSQRSMRCAQLVAERNKIESRYTTGNGSHQRSSTLTSSECRD